MRVKSILMSLVVALTLFGPLAGASSAQSETVPAATGEAASPSETPPSDPVIQGDSGSEAVETEPAPEIPADPNANNDTPGDPDSTSTDGAGDEVDETAAETDAVESPSADGTAPSELAPEPAAPAKAAQQVAPPDLGIDDTIAFTDLTCTGLLTISYTNVPGTTALKLFLLADGAVVGSTTPVITGGSDVISWQFDISGAGSFDSLTAQWRQGPVDRPVIVTSRTVSGCQAGGDGEPQVGDTDAYFRNLTCDGSVQFAWAGYQSDGHFTMHVTADGGDIEYVLMDLADSSGTATLTLPSYAAIAEPGGAGEYHVTAHYVTSGGLVGPTAASATLYTCAGTIPSEPATYSLTVTCGGTVRLSYANVAPPLVVRMATSSIAESGVPGTSGTYQGTITDIAGTMTWAMNAGEQIDAVSLTAVVRVGPSADDLTQVATGTITGCQDNVIEPGITITDLNCDGSGTLAWTNLDVSDKILITWDYDGNAGEPMSFTVPTTDGSWDFTLGYQVMIMVTPDEPDHDAVSMTVYHNTLDHPKSGMTVSGCRGEEMHPSFSLANIACDGTAILHYADLDEEMEISVYPDVIPFPEGKELAGETAAIGPGSDSYAIAIDLSAFTDPYVFTLTVTAGLPESGQDVVSTGMVMDCGLIWVDPTDPTDPVMPVDPEVPMDESVKPVPGGPVKAVSSGDGEVSTLPVTGRVRPESSFPADSMALALGALGLALSGIWRWRRESVH